MSHILPTLPSYFGRINCLVESAKFKQSDVVVQYFNNEKCSHGGPTTADKENISKLGVLC